MQRALLAVFGLLAISLLAIVTVWSFKFFGPGGFTEGKAILGTLQGLEFRNRHSNIKTPKVFMTYPEIGPIIVVATTDQHFPYAWIAGTVDSCDAELCMVGGRPTVVITCSDIVRLEKEVAPAPSVIAFLKRSCT